MSSIQNRYFIILITLLISYGVVVRLVPLGNEESMLQSISEDGYLMMTVARNIALGLGMTTSNGTIPTNGVQPLTTFLWSGVYWLVGGDKVQGVLGIILIQFIIAALAAVLLWQIGIRVLSSNPAKHYIVALAIAMWYASPVTLKHTNNGLETGLYVLAVLGIVLLVVTLTRKWSLRDAVLVGFLLGITFWIRNDAVFLILAVCLMQLFLETWQRHELWQRFIQVNVIGMTAVLIALPWIIYNKVNFGAIMPISGQSESLNVQFGENLSLLPSVLIEYFFMFPLPNSLQRQLLIILPSTILLIAIAIGLWQLWLRLHSPTERQLFVLVGLYLLGLCGFYGLYFGAYFFLERYLFPISPFLALLWAIVVVWAWLKVPWRPIRYGISILFILTMIGVTGYLHIKSYNKHFQLVNWVNQHVSEAEWIASTQTGYLGYFHDRTINLDGKVNPEALIARQQGGDKLAQYLVNKNIDSQRIEYIIDWVFLINRIEKYPLVNQNFHLIVNDPQQNLAVLKRQ
ncbi:MAG: hypothetical protein HC877_08760 [Thioploca sp.]|nr:hypothetical protein [Thioploca sp.]